VTHCPSLNQERWISSCSNAMCCIRERTTTCCVRASILGLGRFAASHCGTSLPRSSGHLAMEYLKQAANIDLTHVPYKGTGPMVTDLLGGQTQATFTGATPLIPHIKQGKLRPIAVGGTKRIAALPDVPTVAESGLPGFETSQWYGILAPAGTPDAIVKKLNTELNRILKSPEVVERMTADGSVPQGSTPEEFAKFIASEQKRWGQVVKTANIKPD